MWFTTCTPRRRLNIHIIVLLQRWTRLLDCVKLLKLYFYDEMFFWFSNRRPARRRRIQPELNPQEVTRSSWGLGPALWPFLLLSLLLTKVINATFKSTKRPNYSSNFVFVNCFHNCSFNRLLLLILIMNTTHNCCMCSMHTMRWDSSKDLDILPTVHPHHHPHPRHNPHHPHHHHHYHYDPESFQQQQQSSSSPSLLESHRDFLKTFATTTTTDPQQHHYQRSRITVQRSHKNLMELAQTKCIARCSCKWRSGKMWVECPDANLHHVPKGLDSGTQVLYLSGNPLSKLEARAFERVQLRNLQRLYLVNCHLTEIHGDTFQQLSNLIELDLSQNELQNLPTNSLQHCPILRKLSLANNRLTIIPNRAFNNLEHLQAIDFSSNQITTIEREAFFGLKNLKHLYLHDNRLRYIDGQTMKNLPTIYELTLHHNPWNCDCSLRTFREWMLEHRIPITYSPNCSQPERLAGHGWTQLTLDEFACPPMVVSVDTEVVVYEGENASIGCIMKAIPNVHIEWEWRGRTIRNMSLMTFGRQMYLIRETYSSAGVMMSLLPVDGVTTSSLDLVDQQEHDHDHDLRQQHHHDHDHGHGHGGEHPTEQDSMQYSASLVQPPAAAASGTSGRMRRSDDPGTSSLDHHQDEDNLDSTYTRTSTLYIMNALEKDSGSYVCIGYNKAGTVSANVTLTVLRRLEVQAAAYSGQEVAGIVIGALVIFVLLLIVIFSLVLRSRKHFHFLPFHHRSTNSSLNNNQNSGNNRQSTNNSNNDNQTAFGSTMMTNDAHHNHHNHNHSNGSNGRIPNGHIQTLTNVVKHNNANNGGKIPNGTLRCSMSSSSETTTTTQATNKSSNLMVVSLDDSKMSGSNHPLATTTITTTATNSNNNGSSNQQCQPQHFVMMDNNNQIIPNHVDITNGGDDDVNNSKNKMNIINNHLIEQIELSDYSTVNDNLCSNAMQPILDRGHHIKPLNHQRMVCGSGGVMNAKNERISPISMASVQSSSSSSLANKYQDLNQQYRFSNGSPVYQIVDSHQQHHPHHHQYSPSDRMLINKSPSSGATGVPPSMVLLDHQHQHLHQQLRQPHHVKNAVLDHHNGPAQHYSPIDDGSIISSSAYDYVRPPMMMMVQPNPESSYFHHNNINHNHNQNHHHHHHQPRNVMTNSCSTTSASSMMMIVELQNRLAAGTAAAGTIGTVTCSMKRDIIMETTPPTTASLQKVAATTHPPNAPNSMMMEMNPTSPPPSSDQVVRFARTPPTVYNYSTSSPTNNHTAIIQQKQSTPTNPLNRLRTNGANPIVARDSPDEGLGEEAD